MKSFARRIRGMFGLAAFAALVAVGACSDTNNVPLLGPGEDGPAESLSLADDLAALSLGEAPVWTEAREHSKIIGPEGGSVYLDLHYLHVPRGAVAGPTKFTVELRNDFRIGASLTATSVNAAGLETAAENNVGAAGFQKPVYLTFSYQYARDVPRNPLSIKVVEVREGRLLVQQTFVSLRYKTATGVLRHFSDYALAWP